MEQNHHVEPKQCSHEVCTDSYTPHHWGAKRAQSLGWFLQKNGDAWCPKHIPDWVVEWRRRNQKEN